MNTCNSLDAALMWLEHLPRASSRAQHSKMVKLDIIKTLLELCENPHRDMRFIHITGSKGKSTMAKTADAILRLEGVKSGLFISPHVNVYNERISINGQMISDEEFMHVLEYVRVRVCEYKQECPDFEPTIFEVLTAAAFCAFRDAQCEWAVVEVGIGGRYDTTNVINPQLCIIGEIEYEHTDVLGHSIEEIAWDKAGIIKPSVPVWVATQVYESVLNLLQEAAAEQGSDLYYMPKYCRIENVLIKKGGTRADISLSLGDATQRFTYETVTLGRALLDDQVLVVAALAQHMLHTKQENQKRSRISTDVFKGRVSMGEEMRLPARCELLNGSPSVFLDGSHTQQSMKNSYACLQALFPRACLVLGMLKNKNHRAACQLVKEHRDFFSHVIITNCGADFDSAHERLYEMMVEQVPTVQLCTDVAHALETAHMFCAASVENKREGAVLKTPVIGVIGSLYLCSTVRALCL